MRIEDFILTAQEFVKRIDRDGLASVENHIVVGDSAELLQYLPEECVDLVHTSPPYNIAKQYRSQRPDLTPLGAYESFLEQVIDGIKRVLKPNGSAFWQTGYTQVQGSIPGDILPIDLLTYQYFRNEPYPTILWDRIIWRYFGGMAFKKKLTNRHETILWYVKPDGKTAEPCFDVDQIREKSRELDKRNNFWGRNPGNVWEVDRVAFGAVEQSSHIAVFPEEISEKLVRAGSRPGNLLLDPFSGSGALPKVARSLGRSWLAIEISEDYALESARRLGYQQPSEVCSLASYIIKFEVFRGELRSMSLKDIGETLAWWLNRLDTESIRRNFDEIIGQALADETPSKGQKRQAWLDLNGRIDQDRSMDPVVIADRFLCRDYKNRRNLNGPTRYRTALETLEHLQPLVGRSGQDAEGLALQVAAAEPSAYAIEGNKITLLTTEKRLKDTGGDRTSFQLNAPETSQATAESDLHSKMILQV